MAFFKKYLLQIIYHIKTDQLAYKLEKSLAL